MHHIYILNHIIENPDREDSVKLIGAFSTQELAEKAITGHRGLSGFTDYPDGFEISRIEIDSSHWNEGFVEVENEGNSSKEQTS